MSDPTPETKKTVQIALVAEATFSLGQDKPHFESSSNVVSDLLRNAGERLAAEIIIQSAVSEPEIVQKESTRAGMQSELKDSGLALYCTDTDIGMRIRSNVINVSLREAVQKGYKHLSTLLRDLGRDITDISDTSVAIEVQGKVDENSRARSMIVGLRADPLPPFATDIEHYEETNTAYSIHKSLDNSKHVGRRLKVRSFVSELYCSYRIELEVDPNLDADYSKLPDLYWQDAIEPLMKTSGFFGPLHEKEVRDTVRA